MLDLTKIDPRENLLSEADKTKEVQRVRTLIKARYPNANVDKLVITFSNKKPMDVVVLGPRGGETKIALEDGSGLQQEFLNKTFVKNILGDSAESIIRQTSATIKKNQQLIKERREKVVNRETKFIR